MRRRETGGGKKGKIYLKGKEGRGVGWENTKGKGGWITKERR